MRAAVSRADDSAEFNQPTELRSCCRACGSPDSHSAESAEWFSEKDLVPASRWTWKKMVRNPAVLAISIAVAVIAGVFVFNLLSRPK